MSRMLLCIATRNQHKRREIEALLRGPELHGLEIAVLGCDDFPGCPDVVEDGDTLEANAEKKARAVCEFTGLPTLADDTGLEVDALGGAPGVLSARYAGPACDFADNIAKLLRELGSVPEARRTARFRCVMALGTPAPRSAPAGGSEPQAAGAGVPCRIELFEGRIDGVIVLRPRGRGGFGYDPVFHLPEAGCTLAELSLAQKNAISHRGRAVMQVRRALVVRYAAEPSLRVPAPRSSLGRRLDAERE